MSWIDPSDNLHTRSYEYVNEVMIDPTLRPNCELVTHGTAKQYA